MNKNDLISRVAEVVTKETGEKLTKKDATVIVDTVFDVVTAELVAGEEVKIAGFGKFTVNDVAGRMGRNPKTNEPKEIAPSKRLKFKVSSALKSAVKGE